MFFLKDLQHTLNLHPSYFGPSTQAYLEQKLHQDVEGTCSGRFGYIVAVNNIVQLGAGTIQPGTGLAQFVVEYRAIVFRPFKGEVLDGVIKNASKMGIFVDIGPISCFVSPTLLPPGYKFDATSNPPSWTSTDDTGAITKSTKVRLKVVGTRIDKNEIFAIGSMREDYLGVSIEA